MIWYNLISSTFLLSNSFIQSQSWSNHYTTLRRKRQPPSPYGYFRKTCFATITTKAFLQLPSSYNVYVRAVNCDGNSYSSCGNDSYSDNEISVVNTVDDLTIKETIFSRRRIFKHMDAMVQTASFITAFLSLSNINIQPSFAKEVQNGKGDLFEINDPNTYSALVYIPSSAKIEQEQQNKEGVSQMKKYPVIVVLHGAGKNTESIWNLANPNGEHAGLIPSLLNSPVAGESPAAGSLVTGSAPSELYENFIVIAPYSFGKPSFYEEPRSKILQFVKWACKDRDAGLSDIVDLNRLILFGFSDGATLGVELMTTNFFRAGVFAAYGFTGTLPPLALERLKGKPMWIFHSKDDVIFPVSCSDRLVRSLRTVNGESNENSAVHERKLIRYTRFEKDQEGFTGSVRGHSTGITASKDREIYQWLLNL